MRWFISYPILAAGLAFGFETVFPSAPDVSQHADAELTLPSFSPAHAVTLASDAEAAPLSRVAAFSPGTNFVVPESTDDSVLGYLAQKLAPRELAPMAAIEPAPLPPVTVTAWKSAVVRVEPAVAAAAKVQAKQGTRSRVALARDIQRELQRVGCYVGEIDGVWGGGSKRAILMFMDRVNASLPTREPDVFMLSLLRGQTDDVCGSACPHGQSLTGGGRCLPTTFVAQAEPPVRGRMVTTSSIETSSIDASSETAVARDVVADAAPAVRPAMPFGRMSIGGPKPADVEALTSGWSTVTVRNGVAPFEKQAALDSTAALDLAQQSGADATSFDTDVAPTPRVKRSKASGRPRAAQRAASRMNNYRHVQRLFEHPLGRM
jgi:hypothetical protein